MTQALHSPLTLCLLLPSAVVGLAGLIRPASVAVHLRLDGLSSAFLFVLSAHVGTIAILLSFGVMQGGSWQFTFDAMRAAQLEPGWAAIAFLLLLSIDCGRGCHPHGESCDATDAPTKGAQILDDCSPGAV